MKDSAERIVKALVRASRRHPAKFWITPEGVERFMIGPGEASDLITRARRYLATKKRSRNAKGKR